MTGTLIGRRRLLAERRAAILKKTKPKSYHWRHHLDRDPSRKTAWAANARRIRTTMREMRRELG